MNSMNSLNHLNSNEGKSHRLILEERSQLRVCGVTEILHFDEEEIAVATDLGELTIRGQGLHLNKIDVEDGELSVEGDLEGLSYSSGPANHQEGWLARLFR